MRDEKFNETGACCQGARGVVDVDVSCRRSDIASTPLTSNPLHGSVRGRPKTPPIVPGKGRERWLKVLVMPFSGSEQATLCLQ